MHPAFPGGCLRRPCFTEEETEAVSILRVTHQKVAWNHESHAALLVLGKGLDADPSQSPFPAQSG